MSQYPTYLGFLYAGDPAFGGGVKANGTTNDTAALNAAFVAAGATGQRLILPAGLILVTAGAVTMANTCHIEGQSNVQYYTETTLPTVQPFGTYIICTGGGTSPLLTPQFGTTIRNLSVFSTSQTMTGINVSNGDILLEHVSVMNCQTGLDFAYSGNSTRVLNCRLTSNLTGIYNPVDSHFASNVINANGGVGVYLSSGCNLNMFVNNRIEWNSGGNVQLAGSPNGAANNTFVGNTLDRSGGAGFSLSYAQFCTITGNIILRSGASASTPGNSSDCTFYLANCTNSIVTNNTSAPGANDDGSGYLSPFYAVYDGGSNVGCILANNGLGYHNNSSSSTTGAINVTTTFNLASAGNVTYHN